MAVQSIGIRSPSDRVRTDYSLVELDLRIEWLFYKKLPPSPPIEQSRMIELQIKNEKTLAQALLILKQQRCGLNSYIFNQLLKKRAPWTSIIKLFNSAPPEIINEYVLSNFISLAGKYGDLDTARKAFIKAQPLRKSSPYTSFIDATGNNNDYTSSKDTFDEASSLEIADAPLFNAFILSAGRNHDFDGADDAFKKAARIANVITFNCYIEAAGNNGALKKAKDVKDQAIDRGIANAATWSTFIRAAWKNGDPISAHDGFIEAENRGHANKMVYNVHIDGLVENNRISAAIALFKKSRLTYKTWLEEKTTIIDLHGLSHGAGTVALHLLKNVVSPFICITGKGCRVHGNYLSFREHLIHDINKYFPSAEIESIPGNKGRFIIKKLT